MISLKDFAEDADPLIYGTVLSAASKVLPQGYIRANGKTLDRQTFSELFSAIGTTNGTGDQEEGYDPTTTFNIPDLGDGSEHIDVYASFTDGSVQKLEGVNRAELFQNKYTYTPENRETE